MGYDLPPCSWQAAWIGRYLPSQRWYTFSLAYALAAASLFIGIRTLVQQNRTKKALDQNPSSRAAILAQHEKAMVRSSRRNYYIALIYMTHAGIFWFIDAGIGFWSIYNSKDVDAEIGPEINWFTDPEFFFALGAALLPVVAAFFAGFILIPWSQITVVSWLLARKFPDGRSLANYVPEARNIATCAAQMWAGLEFAVVVWWSPESYETVRFLAFLAACGSASVWAEASYALVFSAHCLEEVQPKGVFGGVRRTLHRFAREDDAVHGFGKAGADVLPKYETLVQIEEISEKEVV